VLDANLFRGAPIAEIEALRSRGFDISVSLEGLREVWARSLREDNYNLLAARVAKLAPFLSDDVPVAFVGRALLTTFGSADPNLRGDSARFRESVLGGWSRMTKDGLSNEDWRQIGSELQAELAEDERMWAAHVDKAREVSDQVLAAEKEVGFAFYPRSRASNVMRRGLARGAGIISTPPLEQRGDLHLRYVANKLLNVREQEPAKNDWHDARHLQHVAWPAFLVTCDVGLIGAADRTGSPQSAWVRMPIELIEDRVTHCEPWLKDAAEPPFRRGPIPELQARQTAFRERFRRTAVP
jgi:hypothetical protein